MAAAVTHAVITGAWPLSLVAGAAALASPWLRDAPPAEPSLRAAALPFLLALPVAGVVPALPPWLPDPAPSPVLRAVAGALLVAAVVDLVRRRGTAAPAAPLLYGLAIVSVCGFARAGESYTAATALFGVAAVAALAQDGEGPRLSSLARRRRLAVLAGWSVGAALAVAVTLAIPPASRIVGDWVANAALSREAPTGLASSVWLHRETHVLLSDEIVLRVTGGSADHLRGFVNTTYRLGYWSAPPAAGRTVQGGASPPRSPTRVEVVPVKPATRYLFPLGARRVWVERGSALVFPDGLWSPLPSELSGPASFEPAVAADVDVGDVPAPEHTALPDELRPALAAIARQWTAGDTLPEAQLERLADRLQRDFTYALDHRRRTSADPALDFLVHERRGHCEYFASAFALLARSLGIPSRLVTGYRVHERNPAGDYFLVRERDAHAWAEAWVSGRGWVTVDPTPPSFLASQPDRTPWLAGAVDALAERWRRTTLTAPSRGAVAVLAAVLLALGLMRWRAARLRRRPRALVDARDPSGAARSSLERLLAAVERRGLRRAPSEPLEHFAGRLRAAPDGALSPVAELVDRYAALRYGGLSDPGTLPAALDGAAAALDRDVRTAG